MTKKNNLCGTIALTLSIAYMLINLIWFIPELARKITLGWNSGSGLEMVILILWFFQFMANLLCVASFILLGFAIANNDLVWKIVLAITFDSLGIIMLLLTNIFIFLF